MNEIFHIKGGKKLKGEVSVSGFKNAALPILASTIVVRGKSIIKNVPKISDVDSFIDILRDIGAEIKEISKGTFEINTDKIQSKATISHPAIKQMRGSILLLGPLLARFGEVKIPFPGGCVLGKRSADAHLKAFESLGAEIIKSNDHLHLKIDKKRVGDRVVLSEMSVTATENIVTFASFFNKQTDISLAAMEPHVQNLCEFLQSAGAKISGKGTHHLKISGGNLKNGKITVCPDMLEAGVFILAGAMTNSEIFVKNVNISHFDAFFQKLKEVGVNFEANKNTVRVIPTNKNLNAINLKTAVFPGFPTDLMAPFVVLLTQCQGVSRVFETLFEGRFAFLFELEKMGADVELYNPHQALIIGKAQLKGADVASQDIRAGAAMILAALVAKGESHISNVNYIFRGYENIVEKFQKLGADISLIKK